MLNSFHCLFILLCSHSQLSSSVKLEDDSGEKDVDATELQSHVSHSHLDAAVNGITTAQVPATIMCRQRQVKFYMKPPNS